MKNEATVEKLKFSGDAPEWLSDEGYKTLLGGYLCDGETPLSMYKRLAKASAKVYGDDKNYEDKLFNYLWRGWLSPSTPVASNFGTDRGLPISCLTGDTWINTYNGGVQIKDICVGDKVLTHEGRWMPVKAVQSRRSSGDLYKIKIGTRMTPIRVTGNHPVLTNLGWVRVDHLDPSIHYVAVNNEVQFSEEPFFLDISKHIPYDFVESDGVLLKKSENRLLRKAPKSGTVSYYSKIVKSNIVDNDIAWALGLWFAEGSLSTSSKKEPNGLRITVGYDEEHLAKRWLSIITSRFNLNGGFYNGQAARSDFSNGKLCRWISTDVHSKALGTYFAKEFGYNCKDKTLPDWVINLPKEQLACFLEGMLDGDGHRQDKKWTLTLANPKLLLGMYNICLKLGIRVSLQMQAKKSKLGSTAYVYKLNSIVSDSIKLSESNAVSGIKFGKLYFCPIRELEKLDSDDEVYDITVEKDHSFSASGVVFHNCNTIHPADDTYSIFAKAQELAMLSKYGAGVGIYLGDIRHKGAPISKGGVSDGVIPWSKVYDSTTIAVNQAGVRRGNSVVYLPVTHPDIEEFLDLRRTTGDQNRRCMNIHHAVCIPNKWMDDMIAGNKKKRELYKKIITARFEVGEPYILFTDNVNNANPECYKGNNLQVKSSNLCSEITLYTDPDHSFVCCLSSLNLAMWDEWKDTDLVEVSIRFLDSVLTEYIEKASKIRGFEPSVRSAVKGRALGLGVLGWHSLLQDKLIPFDSFQAMQLNNRIFKTIRNRADSETAKLAVELGEPEWCVGFGRRNTHTLAIAPTFSSSIICQSVSAGIEAWAANVFAHKTAKGTFIRKNTKLQSILSDLGKDTQEVWDSIVEHKGSVQHLGFLSKELKEVFLTAREINQFAVVKQAAQRQQYIDQGQSLNLFFASNADPKYINQVHLEAYKLGVKALYYCRAEGVLSGDMATRSSEECKACEG